MRGLAIKTKTFNVLIIVQCQNVSHSLHVIKVKESLKTHEVKSRDSFKWGLFSHFKHHLSFLAGVKLSV